MDKYLRDLERQFSQSPTTANGIKYYAARYRAELGSLFLNTISNFVGSSHEHVNDAISSPGTQLLDPFFVVVCAVPSHDPDNPAPNYSITIHTLLRKPVACRACRVTGPHTHSRATTTSLLPYNNQMYGLDQPIRQWQEPSVIMKQAQRHIYRIAKWVFTTDTVSDVVRLWTDGEWSLRRPSRHQREIDDSIPIANDAGFYLDYIPFKRFGWDASGYKKTGIRQSCQVMFDSSDSIAIPFPHQLPPTRPYLLIGPCEEFHVIPKGRTVYVPEYGELPSGGSVTVMGGPVMHTEMIIDTSTACGHGYVNTEDGAIFPLCPPTWSDYPSTFAGTYCEMCLKVQPPPTPEKEPSSDDDDDYDYYDDGWSRHSEPEIPTEPTPFQVPRAMTSFNICNDCGERMRKSRYLEEMVDYRAEMEEESSVYCPGCDEMSEQEGGECEYCGEPLEMYYNCPFCKNSYDTIRKATDCCVKITQIDYAKILEDYPKD